jgi:predicted DNA-binding transcriptional regulator AlpA
MKDFGSGFLKDREVAAALGMKVSTLRRWRLLRKGPPFHKIGAAVRYSPKDLDTWLSARLSSAP